MANKKPRHKKAKPIVFKKGEFKTKSKKVQKFMEQSGAKLFIEENVKTDFEGIIPYVIRTNKKGDSFLQQRKPMKKEDVICPPLKVKL